MQRRASLRDRNRAFNPRATIQRSLRYQSAPSYLFIVVFPFFFLSTFRRDPSRDTRVHQRAERYVNAYGFYNYYAWTRQESQRWKYKRRVTSRRDLPFVGRNAEIIMKIRFSRNSRTVSRISSRSRSSKAPSPRRLRLRKCAIYSNPPYVAISTTGTSICLARREKTAGQFLPATRGARHGLTVAVEHDVTTRG